MKPGKFVHVETRWFRVLVCGSRSWDDPSIVGVVLAGYERRASELGGRLSVISGMARGADSHAAAWADNHSVPLLKYPADWKTFGKRAGFVRNKRMLDEGRPDVVVAFARDLASSRGTNMMVELARSAGVKTWVVS